MKWSDGKRFTALCLAVLALDGCTDSTAPPPPPPPSYTFEPASEQVSLLYAGQLTFSVRVQNAATPTVVFRRGDVILPSSGNSFIYHATQVGPDSLRAEVTTAAGVAKTWRIWVDGGYGDRPAPAQGLRASVGPRPGTLHVDWTRAAPVLNPRPVAQYLVGVRYGTLLTEANWDAALVLEEVPSTESTPGYGRDYADLPGGELAWIGVRAEDVEGRLSPLGEPRLVRVPGAYWISGAVTDDEGAPLSGLSVSVGAVPEQRTVTQIDGSFTLPRAEVAPDGFRDIDKYVLAVRDETGTGTGLFYDFVSDSLSAADVYPQDVVMIPARTSLGGTILSAACATSEYQGEFLSFVRGMTNARTIGISRLYRWDHHPLTYWIQDEDFVTPDSIALTPLVRAATAAWNARLGGTWFVEIADSVSADVVVLYAGLPNPIYGQTMIVDPYNAPINLSVPRKMSVTVEVDLQVLKFARGIILHEFGHALCMGGHSRCGGNVHIMQDGAFYVPPSGDPGDAQADMEAAISDDEVRLVRLLRELPQGVNINQYSLD